MEIFHHFQYPALFDLQILGIDISITKATITIWIAAFLVLLIAILASRKPTIIPGKIQNLAESLIDFIRNEMLFDMADREKNTWIPFLLGLFSIILMCNLISLVPGVPAVTASLNFTATLAIIVALTSQGASFKKHGFTGYFKHFIPKDTPGIAIPFLYPIEIITQLARPFSLALRLFANIFAGHVVILVFLTLILIFKNYFGAIFPLIGAILISAFEIFIGFIQAFIFTYLSAMYITEAVAEH